MKQLSKDIGWEEVDVDDEGSESDELRSLQGSDEEEEDIPWFHEKTDFKNPIVLVKKLRFSNSTILRKALRIHAIENKYEYYYLHNGGKRITTFCKRMCKCKWNFKRCKVTGECNCSARVKKCRFKVSARRVVNSDAWQIIDFRPKHVCMRSKMNSMVNAEFLAERYVEEWRRNPSWDLKSFRARVLSDLGIVVKYSKAWLARARAKLMIYGSACEQYARVWDYGKAVIKYSPGSGVAIVVDVDESRPELPLLMRMYICLQPLRSGFIKGCRPLIGLDGCHLKGAYPGQILVAVGKDGNNNIYPVAWATVEVENKESWCWFLGCLKKDLGDVCEGGGWTFMSDKQKGLLEALELQVPFAEKRFCVRHIWANFKLQFSGSTFKELFWNAARATTVVSY
ncbi:uncharacterized protein LOC110739693 [Chenopodium quinoa]|uniref:uncharacterized protein LOC110739693 n=1 Tax=Chenopodium quinoa TaxID=63459 RepID=UPI000B7885C4|nr:uncharacterized protein LOC110739693 [Chenopodium quinoa]